MNAESILDTDSNFDNDNQGGGQGKLFYCKHGDISGHGVPSGAATLAALVEVPWANITVANLEQIDAVEFTDDVSHERIGEAKGRSFKHNVPFTIHSSDASRLGFSKATANADLAIFVVEAGGAVRLLGNPVDAARIVEETGQLGKAREEFRGSAFTAEGFGTGPAPIVTGVTVADLVALAEASGSGS